MLLAILAASAHARPFHDFVVHNPSGVTVSTIHLVQSAHFDGGCKTFGCSDHLAVGEPDRCTAHHAEPYSYHILNRWFDVFLMRGVAYANASRGTPHPYRHLVQPWIASLFFDCENAGLASWPGSGWTPAQGAPLLHCPNASTTAEVRGAFKRGDLYFHAFPHNGEASAYPSAELFDAALGLPQALAASLGIAAPTAVSQRDVPGWTRATIPLLRKRGINGLSVGAGQPPGKPDVPPLFVWRDELSGTDIVVSYESSYGEVTPDSRHNSTIFVLPNGVAMAAGWWGDNGGPAPPANTQEDWVTLAKLFPDATVLASTFDEFFVEANKPEVKAKLPVVTAEIGDGWIYGVPSDPLKNTLFREIDRQRSACVKRGECDPTSDAMRAFDRLLVKVPEHTWGVAGQIWMPDFVNYTNAQFDTARVASQKRGFSNVTSSLEADYNTTAESWKEQRLYVTDAPKLLAKAHPTVAKAMADALAALQDVKAPRTEGLTRCATPSATTFVCGGVTVGFDARGALTTLRTSDGAEWASEAKPVGLYNYRTYTNEDYNIFLQDFASRVDGPGCGGYGPGHVDDMNCKNFRKPNISSASPKRRVVVPALTALWSDVKSSSSSSTATTCHFVAEMAMDAEAHALAGAPATLAYGVNVSASGVTWDVVQLAKRPTRLPEAGFFTFNPAVDVDEKAKGKAKGWTLTVLGSEGIDPTNVVGSSDVYGGSPHLRGVEVASWSSPTSKLALRLTSLDVPIMSVGAANPFPSPRTEAPDMSKGVHWNLFQNLWNTNYILWYPFTGRDASIRSRFELAFVDSVDRGVVKR